MCEFFSKTRTCQSRDSSSLLKSAHPRRPDYFVAHPNFTKKNLVIYNLLASCLLHFVRIYFTTYILDFLFILTSYFHSMKRYPDKVKWVRITHPVENLVMRTLPNIF